MNIKKYFHKYKFPMLFCLGLTLISIFPFFLEEIHKGHDIFFHLSRIEGIVTALQDHQFLPKIYPYKNGCFGYPSPLFYSDVFLYIPAILYYLGLSLFDSYALLIGTSTFFSAYFMFITTKNITSSNKASYISTILYILSYYRLLDIHVRAAVGEVLALTFLPLLILAVYQLIYEKKNCWELLTFSFTAIFLSHNISFILAVILFAIFLLLNFKTFLKNPNLIFTVIKATVAALGLTAFFTLPMLEQMLHSDLNVEHFTEMYSLAENSLPLAKIFENGTGLGRAIWTLPEDEQLKVHLGWILTFSPLLSFFLKKEVSNKKFIIEITALGYAFLLMSTSLFPWSLVENLLLSVQFPWRLLLLSLPLFSISAAYSICKIINTKYVVQLVLIISLFQFFYQTQPLFNSTTKIQHDLVYSDISGNTYIDPYMHVSYNRNELSGAEYLPYTLDMNYREFGSCVRFTNLDTLTCDVEIQGTTRKFDLNLDGSYDYLLMPVTYYKGYQAYHQETEESPLVPIYTNSDEYYKTVVIEVKGYQSGKIVLKYIGTTLQKLSLLLSIFTLFFISFIQFKKIKQ